MKTLLLILLLVPMMSFGQNVNIPDANFKNYLVGEPLINTNGDNEIQVSEASAYTDTIDCSAQNISDLTGIEDFTSLTALICFNNQITYLDVSNNAALAFLHCQGNELISLDLSNNLALEAIYCGLNQLVSLDLPNSSALTFLDCFGNQLTFLNVSQNITLGMMGCGGNQLTSLDVSNNSYLSVLACNNNQLECLNVKNGNNESFINIYADGNPNLTCIEVDDVNYSIANWTNIDSQTSFSSDCNNNGCSCDTYSSIIEIGLDLYTSPSGTVYTTGGVYTDTIQNAAGCDSIITIDLSLNYTGIGELNNTPKQLIKIVDVLGRETPFKPNTPLLYIYNDGTVERKMIIKE